MNLAKAYADLSLADTDMKAHMAVLHDLAKDKRVIEFGTRRGVSTVAMLAAHPKSLTTYDTERSGDLVAIEAAAEDEGIPFSFQQEDIDSLEKIGACDFVFCDSHHNGTHLAHELEMAHSAGATAVAIHDTEIFGWKGDLPNTSGLFDAIFDFIAQHKDWQISSHNPACYGLTVLRR